MDLTWTETTDLNTARNYMGGAGVSSICFDIHLVEHLLRTGKNEIWNGTSWVENTDLNTGENEIRWQEHTTDGNAFGGTTGTNSTNSNRRMEFNK